MCPSLKWAQLLGVTEHISCVLTRECREAIGLFYVLYIGCEYKTCSVNLQNDKCQKMSFNYD